MDFRSYCTKDYVGFLHHKTSHLWFAHSSTRIYCLTEDVNTITINVGSVEFLTFWWGLSFHHCRLLAMSSGGREISRLLKSWQGTRCERSLYVPLIYSQSTEKEKEVNRCKEKHTYLYN